MIRVETSRAGLEDVRLFSHDKTMRTDEQAMDGSGVMILFPSWTTFAYLRKLRDMTRADDGQTLFFLSTFDLKPFVEKLIRLQHAPGGKQSVFPRHISRTTCWLRPTRAHG